MEKTPPTCQLQDCAGHAGTPRFVDKEAVKLSKKLFGIIICRHDMTMIKMGTRKQSGDYESLISGRRAA